MRLGYIDYLNCYPFYHKLFEKDNINSVEIYSDYPGRLNELIANGELDLSPISSAVYPEIYDEVTILPDFCLSSIGYVGSVILESKIPIEDLHKKKIGITNSSKTSVILLKILLKKYYNIDPEYLSAGPKPGLVDFDAALVIGNDAMNGRSKSARYSYDLGDLWLRKTGYPVVFAIFGVRNDFLDRNKILDIVNIFKESMEYFKNKKSVVIKKAIEKYPEIRYDVKSYYDLLQYNFTGELKEALVYYFSIAEELGLLNKIPKINYFKK
jgi:chorismate dehydratase